MRKAIRAFLGENYWKRLLFDVTGTALFSIGITCFIAPNDIAPGGVSALAIMLNHLIGLPIGLGTFMMNLPLFILAFFMLGRAFVMRTAQSVVFLSLFLDLSSLLPVFSGDQILAALLGGVLLGLGIGTVMLGDSTTGGGDIAGRLLQLRFPFIPIGRMLFFIDLVILFLSVLVFKRLETALYGIIVIFISAQVVDQVVYGGLQGKIVYIFSQKHQELARAITEEMHRGVTILEGRGGYSGERRPVIFCAVAKPQYHELALLVRKTDPDAFLVAAQADEILGQGFHPLIKGGN